MLHLTFSMVPSIVFAPNICRTQNTDTGRKTQTQLISALITTTESACHFCEKIYDEAHQSFAKYTNTYFQIA